MKFNIYNKIKIKLKYLGVEVINSYLKEDIKNRFTYIINEYGDPDKEYVDECIGYYKETYPQRFVEYKIGDYYEDDFDFIMNILMKSLTYNNRDFSDLYCYFGEDGFEDGCFIEIGSE